MRRIIHSTRVSRVHTLLTLWPPIPCVHYTDVPPRVSYSSQIPPLHPRYFSLSLFNIISVSPLPQPRPSAAACSPLSLLRVYTYEHSPFRSSCTWRTRACAQTLIQRFSPRPRIYSFSRWGAPLLHSYLYPAPFPDDTEGDTGDGKWQQCKCDWTFNYRLWRIGLGAWSQQCVWDIFFFF